MGAIHRLATVDDAGRLYEVRRRSILELAPPTMSVGEAQAWATQLTLPGMERKLRDLEIWVAERDGTVAGWGAIRDEYLQGLYAAPEFVGRGVGTELLGMLEGLMRQRGVEAVRTEASPNARDSNARRGLADHETTSMTPAGEAAPDQVGDVLAWL